MIKHKTTRSNEMGDYLSSINLGSGVEIELCFDYSPTSSPTMNPTNSYGPTSSPSLYSIPICSSKFAFYAHNCILTSSQQIKCFGRNNMAQLGYGDSINRGDQSNQMGDYLPFVNLNENIISIHSGYEHSCSLLTTLDVKCWGRNNNYGQLGYGDTNNRGDEGNEMGSYLPTINFGSNVLIVDLSVGRDQNMILSDSDQIKSWGRNDLGQLGYGDTNDRGKLVNEMGDYLSFVSMGSGGVVISAKAGQSNHCSLLDNLDMKCWGRNDFGQLGQGSTTNLGKNPNEIKYINYQLQPKVNL